jgi:hypothetical protein
MTATPLPNQQSWASRTFKGRDPQMLQQDTLRPDQIQFQQDALQRALSQLQNPQSGFAPIAQRAQQQFAQQTIPSIMERFSGLGSGGAQNSSAFAQTLGAAGAGLQSDLAAQGAQYGLQQQGLAQQLAQLGLSPSFTSSILPGSEGIGEKLLGGFAEMAPRALGAYLTGGMSEMGNMGGMFSSLQNLFGGRQQQAQQPQQGGYLPNPQFNQVNPYSSLNMMRMMNPGAQF